MHAASIPLQSKAEKKDLLKGAVETRGSSWFIAVGRQLWSKAKQHAIVVTETST